MDAYKVKIDHVEYEVEKTLKETNGYVFLVEFAGGSQWVDEDDTNEVLFECDECDRETWVEAGTWALDRGFCYSCNCKYEGG